VTGEVIAAGVQRELVDGRGDKGVDVALECQPYAGVDSAAGKSTGGGDLLCISRGAWCTMRPFANGDELVGIGVGAGPVGADEDEVM
jgi:hypothetical protein